MTATGSGPGAVGGPGGAAETRRASGQFVAGKETFLLESGSNFPLQMDLKIFEVSYQLSDFFTVRI